MNSQDYFNSHFGLYSKIQDHLMYIGNYENLVSLNITLNMYNKKLENNNYYYKEIQYVSNKLNAETRKIRRDYDIYLSLENTRPIGTYREYIMIRGKDIEFFRMNLLPRLEEIINRFDEIYMQSEFGKLIVTDAIKPFELTVGNKTLMFSPGISSNGEESYPVVDMYMNSNRDNIVAMNFDQIYGFMYIIRTIDLYNYASSMLAYIQRPPSTTNLIDITMDQDPLEPIPIEDPSKRRFVGDSTKGTSKISYFHKK